MRRLPAVSGVSCTVDAGEVLGMADLLGSGRSSLLRPSSG